MKNKKWILTLIIVLSILMIGLTVFYIGLIQNGFHLKGLKLGLQNSEELIVDTTYEENFKKITIDATTSNIFINHSNTNHITTRIYGKKEDTNVDATLDTLTIKTNEKNCIGFCFNQKATKIEIELPEDFDGTITIQNKYGNISIDTFLNATMDIKEDCGDVKILAGKSIKVDNKYGDVEIKKADDATINEDCGDVTISTIQNVIVKNNYGDIEIETVTNSLHLENDCGDIQLNNINLKKDSYIKDDYGDIEIGLTNELFIDAKTDLGKVSINKNTNEADVTLKIQNNCGDIEVEN